MSIIFFVTKNEKNESKPDVLYLGYDLWPQRKKAHLTKYENF